MAKIKKVEYKNKEGKVVQTKYLFNCPGCDHEHAFSLRTEGGNHTFNMDLEDPTIFPSWLKDWDENKICHSFIKDGKIRFLNDCWHALKGQTIELPEIF